MIAGDASVSCDNMYRVYFNLLVTSMYHSIHDLKEDRTATVH